MGSGNTGSAVTLRDLTRTFGGFTAVNKVTLEVAPGEIFGFLGPNGAGKSTTIRMLCGILPPTSGSGSVAGFDIGTEAEEIKRHIGYMSQKFSLYEDLTVEENINFYGAIYRIPAQRRKERKEWVLEMAGLAEKKTCRTGVLSTGWKQRLALGCALLHEPRILFLDEPTSGVDPISRRNFWDLIYEQAENGVTVFVTTHYMDEAEYCDRLGLIYRGELIALGPPSLLKKDYMQQEIIEVLCDDPHGALDLLERTEAIQQASMFGRGIHIVTGNAAEALPLISSLFRSHGISISRMEKIDPSLEDVFISLIEARDRLEGEQEAVRR